MQSPDGRHLHKEPEVAPTLKETGCPKVDDSALGVFQERETTATPAPSVETITSPEAAGALKANVPLEVHIVRDKLISLFQLLGTSDSSDHTSIDTSSPRVILTSSILALCATSVIAIVMNNCGFIAAYALSKENFLLADLWHRISYNSLFSLKLMLVATVPGLVTYISLKLFPQCAFVHKRAKVFSMLAGLLLMPLVFPFHAIEGYYLKQYFCEHICPGLFFLCISIWLYETIQQILNGELHSTDYFSRISLLTPIQSLSCAVVAFTGTYAALATIYIFIDLIDCIVTKRISLHWLGLPVTSFNIDLLLFAVPIIVYIALPKIFYTRGMRLLSSPITLGATLGSILLYVLFFGIFPYGFLNLDDRVIDVAEMSYTLFVCAILSIQIVNQIAYKLTKKVSE